LKERKMKNDTLTFETMSDAISVNSIFDRRMVETILGSYDALSPYTLGRTFRMAQWASELGKELEFEMTSLNEVGIASMLCDLGMWVLPLEIINKKGRLTLSEFKIVQKHPELSLKAMEGVQLTDGIRRSILHSHESFDGTGYPTGLKGDEIPPGAQIVNICATLFSLTSKRPYRDPVAPEAAFQIIRSEERKQFHPNIVNACGHLVEKGIIKSVLEQKIKDPFQNIRREIAIEPEMEREQKKYISGKLSTDENKGDADEDTLNSIRTKINDQSA
jgi:HD-GYP domain-containing protein (c-di-GMP phosphodiesterase class II)